jgi:hypothetical protein
MKIDIKTLIVALFSLNLLTILNAAGETEARTFTYSPSSALVDQTLMLKNIRNPIFTDTSNLMTGAPFKILIMGNSLSSHGKSPEIGWTHASGMAATSIEKDYAHLLSRKIEAKLNRRVDLKIGTIVEFERHFESFKLNSLNTLKIFNADLIIIQNGENVQLKDESTAKIYQEKFIQLINWFRSDKATIICTTSFFPSNEKNKIVSTAACETNSFLVDLSHLSMLDPKNLAKNEPGYGGDKTKWKVKGIGTHPGDLGMKNIAEELFVLVNALLSKREKEESLRRALLEHPI